MKLQHFNFIMACVLVAGLAAQFATIQCASESETADASIDAPWDVTFPSGADGDMDTDSDGDSDNENPPSICDPDACVPRACAITREEADFFITDAGSTNPDYLGYWGHESYAPAAAPPTSDGILKIEVYPSSGSPDFSFGPREVVLEGRDLQYASCRYCVRYFDAVRYDGDGGLANPEDITFFMACNGTLTIDDMTLDAGPDGGSLFQGRLTATFVEVTIDEYWVSRPVPDGGAFCIEDIPFRSSIRVRPNTY